MIGQSDYFGFGFTTLDWNLLLSSNEIITKCTPVTKTSIMQIFAIHYFSHNSATKKTGEEEWKAELEKGDKFWERGWKVKGWEKEG